MAFPQKPRFLWLNWMLIRLKELPFVAVPSFCEFIRDGHCFCVNCLPHVIILFLLFEPVRFVLHSVPILVVRRINKHDPMLSLVL